MFRKLIRNINIFIATLLLTSLPITSDAKVLELDDAISVAFANNPSILKLQARYRALSELPSQASSLPDPMLMINAMNLPTDSFDTKQEPMTQMQVGIGQGFPFPGKLGLRKEVKTYQAFAALHSVEELKVQVASHVKQNWWQLFFLDRAIDVINNNQNLMRELLDVARKKYEVGKGLQQDVLLAQLELSKLLDKEIELKSMRSHANIKLNILMDFSPSKNNLLPKKTNEHIQNVDNEQDLYLKAEQHRGRLLEKKQLKEAAQSNLKLAKKGYYPDFKVSVVYGERRGENPPPMRGERTDFLSVMLNANMPIYASSKQSREICQRAEELASSKFAVHDELNNVKAEIAMALTDLAQFREQYLLFKTGIVPQAQQTVSSMLSAYQVNKVDFLNLVRSQITLFNYELQYWKAFTEAQQSLARLNAAVGEGTEYVK
jgi:cobalt-zinc-cadmium efflux system outer membrane protein